MSLGREGFVDLDDIKRVGAVPARCNAFRLAGIGPRPINAGSIPVVAMAARPLAPLSAHQGAIVDAIARTVERSESDDEFQRTAEKRWAQLRETGKSVAFDEARAYLEARAQGGRPARPSARKLAF